MYKAIIVDDEPKAIKVLSLLLNQYCPEVEIVGTASNINDGYRLIIEINPNLLFLDINMPNGSGLELLERIQHLNTNTILTTAYQQFAIEALRLSALDYLLKPIAKEELINAVNRLNDKKKESARTIGHFDNENPKISIKTIDGLTILNLKDIQFVQSHKNYSIFHIGMDEIVSSRSLGDYEELLEGFGFIRVHRSTIVQVSHIKELKKGRNWTIILQSNHKIEVSRNKHEELNQALNTIQ